ncbi:MAG: ribonuclease HII [bacterium]
MNDLKQFDLSYYSESVKYIAGVDEVGRGPIAGPVVAAAVIFDKETFIEGINDSKKVSEKNRMLLYPQIIKCALSYGIAECDNYEIDKINILNASLKAMKMAVEKLKIKPDLVLIDGNKEFKTELKTLAVIKGDGKSFSIAAASIIAKITRDKLMTELDKIYPCYLWAKNKGYPTKEHFNAVYKNGITGLHRKSFLTNYLEKIPINFED